MRCYSPALISALLVLLAAPALAATTPPGVNLRWDNCYGDGGIANKTFACDTNVGIDRLVLSYVLSEPLANVAGVEISLEVAATTSLLPAWWLLFDLSNCRSQGLSITADLPATAVNCSDWANGQASMNIAVYDVSYFGARSAARIEAITAVRPSQLATLSPGVEYSAANFMIRHVKTVGTAACAGCDVPVCLIVGRLIIDTTDIYNYVTLFGGANGPGSQVATWQGGVATNLHLGFIGTHVATVGDCVLSNTPARAPTWGAVKALYR